MAKANWKLTAPDWCFYRAEYNPPEYYKKVKEVGYDGVEMVPSERRQAALDAGLPIITLSGPGMISGLVRKENHEQLMRDILLGVEDAARWKVPYLIVFSGSSEGVSMEEGRENCVRAFEKILPKMEGTGVSLLFEPLNPMDHSDYQGCHAEYALWIAEHLQNPQFQILYDLYHLYKIGDDGLKDLPRMMPYIGHFHLAAVEKRGAPEKCMIIPHEAFFKALPESFKGYIGLEFSTSDPANEMVASWRWANGFR